MTSITLCIRWKACSNSNKFPLVRSDIPFPRDPYLLKPGTGGHKKDLLWPLWLCQMQLLLAGREGQKALLGLTSLMRAQDPQGSSSWCSGSSLAQKLCAVLCVCHQGFQLSH